MKKIFKKICIPAIFYILFWGCSDNTEPVRDARKLSIDEVSSIPGFTWFSFEYSNYEPDPLIVEDIKKSFNPAIHKILFFVKPACTCEIPQEPFPHILKTLRLANVNDTLSEIFSMTNKSDLCPYSHKLPLAKLPTIYIMNMNDTVPVYSIMDTINMIKQLNKDSVIQVEKLILDGLRK